MRFNRPLAIELTGIACLITAIGMVLAADCPEQGDSSEARLQALDRLKNRTVAPTDIDSSITLEKILESGDDTNRFTSDQAARVTGYVIEIKRGGRESCNCHSVTDRDWHIEIGQTPDAPEDERMIVEVTPRFTPAGWSRSAIEEGSLVTVTGWMFFDEEHKQNAALSNPKGTNIWRATAWEIHPVTEVAVIK